MSRFRAGVTRERAGGPFASANPLRRFWHREAAPAPRHDDPRHADADRHDTGVERPPER